MKKEERNILLADLCARLPHGVKAAVYNQGVYKIAQIYADGLILAKDKNPYNYIDAKLTDVEYVKPYLFPISSMTEEQKEIYTDIDNEEFYCKLNGDNDICYKSIDWLNAHHFDYRGLIEKGLAYDATKLNIY